MWKEKVQPYIKNGDLQVVGVVQEQHPDRAKLYRQWKNLDFSIFVDSLNLLNSRVVPIPVALDRNGVVRMRNMKPDELDEFMEKDYPDVKSSENMNRASIPDPEVLKKKAKSSDTASDWRALGDALFLTRTGPEDVNGCIEAYKKAVKKKADDARAHFRLGVALRTLYDFGKADVEHAQEAIKHWQQALSLRPNQYIWRRRLQQYGPRLDKPYNFYFWVNQARKEIKERGEDPVELAVEPRGSEIEPPQEQSDSKQKNGIPDPDPEGNIIRDEEKLVQLSEMVTPYRVQPGQRVRVRLKFKLSPDKNPYWNNEAKTLVASLDLPEGITLADGKMRYPNPEKPETRETRYLEFELEISKSLEKQTVTLPGYALYYVCKDKQGVCLYLRQDFQVDFVVDPDAPALK